MQTDPTDLLHLYHCLWPRRAALTGLLERFDFDAATIRRAGPADLAAAGIDAATIQRIRQRPAAGVDEDIAWAGQNGNHLLACNDPDYPALLRQIDDFPPLLYARGDPGLLRLPQVAIVGSRNCTPGGAQHPAQDAGFVG